jgi:diguanylate cyclase (GGDEF)-like protein/PAS domain S-box-containing protein
MNENKVIHFGRSETHQANPTSSAEYCEAMLALCEATDDAMFFLVHGANGVWTIGEHNKTTKVLFNAKHSEVRGRSLEQIFGKNAFCENGHHLPDLCAKTGQPLESEAYLAAQGDEYWVTFNWWHIKFSPFPKGCDNVTKLSCICRCTTDKRELQGALQKFSSAITQASSIIAIVELQGTSIEYINPAFEFKTGYSGGGAIGQGIFETCMPQGADKLYAPLVAAMASRDPWHGELPSHKADGTVYWESVRISPITNDEGTTSHYLFIKEDITEKRAIESDLKLASRALETTDAGVLITDSTSRIISVNPAFTRITGYSEAEVIGKTPRMLSSGEHDAALYQNMWQQLIANGSWSGELIDRKKNGQSFVESIAISAMHDKSGKATHYVGVFSDITALKESQSQLEQLAKFDTLTQLPNRLSLQASLQRALLRAKRDEHYVAVILFDLDHFKAVNDTLGHPAGDALLKIVSQRALSQLRDEDTLARLGGDEFVAVLEGIDTPERISGVVERIIEEINLPICLEGSEVFVGCSVGITFYPKDGIDSDILMRNADLALYRAKDDGKNCYRLYSEEMNASAHKRYLTETRLRKAIELGELAVVYQPQFDSQNRKLIGAEALLRWNNPEIGNISPTTFIPIAEQTGLIVPIGLWVLEQVCLLQKSLQDAGGPQVKIAVNVSPVQFRQKDLVESFEAIFTKTGVTSSCIEVEVTEGTIMGDANSAIETLRRMRTLGLSIALDDFGTGYSSLGYLKKFPIDKIKIDRTFINDLETDPDDAVIISAIVALSTSLGMTPLAEGVETDRQLHLLQEAGCNQIQGYLLGRPMPKTDFLAMLNRFPSF